MSSIFDIPMLTYLIPLFMIPLYFNMKSQRIDYITQSKNKIFRILVEYKEVGWFSSPDIVEFGNGILIAHDIILTNYHIVSEYIIDTSNKINKTLTISNNLCSLKDNEIEIVVVDKIRDLCIIRIKEPDKIKNIQPFKLTNIKAEVGDDVIAIQATDDDLEEEYLITFGKSGIYFDNSDNVHYLSTNLHIPPGFSGTPLLDTRGNVIGLNTESYDPAQQISGSVAVSEMIAFLDNCCIKGYVRA